MPRGLVHAETVVLEKGTKVRGEAVDAPKCCTCFLAPPRQPHLILCFALSRCLPQVAAPEVHTGTTDEDRLRQLGYKQEL